jgi:hypothetical protein
MLWVSALKYQRKWLWWTVSQISLTLCFLIAPLIRLKNVGFCQEFSFYNIVKQYHHPVFTAILTTQNAPFFLPLPRILN